MNDHQLITIHHSAKVSPLADLEPSTKNTRIIVGEDCMIDSFVKIKPVGGNADVVLGKRCYINSGCVLYSGNGIRIGDNVLITLVRVNNVFGSNMKNLTVCLVAFSRFKNNLRTLILSNALGFFNKVF